MLRSGTNYGRIQEPSPEGLEKPAACDSIRALGEGRLIGSLLAEYCHVRAEPVKQRQKVTKIVTSFLKASRRLTGIPTAGRKLAQGRANGRKQDSRCDNPRSLGTECAFPGQGLHISSGNVGSIAVGRPVQVEKLALISGYHNTRLIEINGLAIGPTSVPK